MVIEKGRGMKPCMDCGADISHKRSDAKRCEECAYKIKIERNRLRHHHDPEYRRDQRERIRKWRQQNPENVKQQQERARERRKNNPEDKRRQRQLKQKPEYKEKARRRKQSPEYKKQNQEYNRKRRQHLGGDGYRRAWPDLLLRDGPYCGICGEPLDPIHSNFHVDHITPVAHGGTNDLSNLQLAHPHCNMSKSATWDGTAPAERPAQLPLFA